MFSLSDFLRKHVNPFCDTNSQLVTLGTKDVMEEEVAFSLIECHEQNRE